MQCQNPSGLGREEWCTAHHKVVHLYQGVVHLAIWAVCVLEWVKGAGK